LNGRRVPLSGSQIVKGKLAGKRHRYRVLSSSSRPQAGETTLLAPSAEVGGGLTCAPAPQGCLRIIEGPQESLSGNPIQPIPASPPPQIPPGLKPRFCAFGGNPPVTGPGSPLAHNSPTSGKRKKKMQMPEASVTREAVNRHGALEVDKVLGSPEMDVEKKKKKKKQQLKEPEGTEPAAMEPTAEMLEPLGVLLPSSTKKKQHKGAETFELEEKTVEPELIKTEPLEETVLSPTKKRKRPKETKGMEPVEGMRVESQLQVKVEPQEEAIALPPVKKWRKGKWQNTMTEPVTEATEPGMGPRELPGEMMKPELPDGAEPWTDAALASTKKKKKERGDKVTEPRTEMIDAPRETVAPEMSGEGEPGATAPGSTKKRKKRSQESGLPETASQQETPEPLLNLESGGEVAPTEGREKKRKKRLQQEPV
ncbi:DNA-directed RNA polymerase I subunit RPA34 isoform 1, partial [Daubentonia madagascariensis]